MKYLAATILAFASTTATASADDFVISGNMPAVPDSTIVSLFQFEGKSGSSIAIDTVVNGHFRLSSTLDKELTKTDFNLFRDGESLGSRTIYLRPGAEVSITANDPFESSWYIESNVPEQTENDRFITESENLLRLIEQQKHDMRKALEMASDSDEKSAIRAKYKAMRDSLEVATMLNDIDILRQTPISTVWLDKFEDLAFLYTIYDNYKDTLAKSLKEIYENLDDSTKHTDQAARAYVFLYPAPKLKVGDSMPDAVFKDIDGNSHSLAEKRGKWILLDFWSGGCYPCIMSMPEIHEFAEKYADTAAVISLSIDGDKVWRRATEMHNVTGNNWNEGKADIGIYNRFGTNAVPTFALISPEGIIKSIFMGYSKGQFERELKLHMRAKEDARYSEENGIRSITNPEYLENQTSAILDIDLIELSDKGATIHFSYIYQPGWWFSIDPQAYITTDDGTVFKLTSSEGITLGAHTYADESGSGTFSLTFEPVPTSYTGRISFKESADSDWAIKGIRIHE